MTQDKQTERAEALDAFEEWLFWYNQKSGGYKDEHRLAKFADEVKAVLSAPQQSAPVEREGHDVPCVFCGEKTNDFAANPALWSSWFMDGGAPMYCHAGCLTKKLFKPVEVVEGLDAAIYTASQTIEGYIPLAFGKAAIGKCLKAARLYHQKTQRGA